MSGYNQRAVIAFLRYLDRLKYSNYAIMASSKDDTIFRTTYKNKVIYTRQEHELSVSEFEAFLTHTSKEKGIFIPSTEALIRFQLDNRDLFTKHNITLPLVNRELYQSISDKRSFWNICRDHNLLVPALYDVNHVQFPLVAKPITYYSKKGICYSPIIVDNKDSFDEFLKHHDLIDFDLEQYINGESYYLLLYITKNGIVHSFSQKNLLQQIGGKSILAAVPAHIHEAPIAYEYTNMLIKIGFWGLIMIELRKSNDGYYMIEANPRLWGPSQLLIDAESDLFNSFLIDNGINLPQQSGNPRFDVRYYWSGGISEGHTVSLIDIDNDYVNNRSLYEKYDIYNRTDTIEIYSYERGLHGKI